MASATHLRGGFAGLPPEWQAFVSQTAATFDQTLPWFSEFERHLLESGHRLHLLGVVDNAGAPLAMLPLVSKRILLTGRLYSSGLAALSNYYTGLFSPLALPGREFEVAKALAAGMLAIEPHTAVIDLNPVADDGRLEAELARRWEHSGYRVERYFRFGNWYLETRGRSSAEYFATLPGQLRSTLERKGKKLRARADVRIRVISDPAELPVGLAGYETVYRNSWKTDEPHKEFVRAVCREFAGRDWLRMGLVEVDSVPVAAQIWFVYRGTASIFKLAYDSRFGSLSAGSILTMSLMQRVLDVDRVTLVDYLSGDDTYKRDWMSARRERIGLRAVRRRSWQGTLSAVLALLRRRHDRGRGVGAHEPT